ncbi:hypothetical protein Hanom_Chr12g01090081 [Helianthus anomalus]
MLLHLSLLNLHLSEVCSFPSHAFFQCESSNLNFVNSIKGEFSFILGSFFWCFINFLMLYSFITSFSNYQHLIIIWVLLLC